MKLKQIDWPWNLLTPHFEWFAFDSLGSTYAYLKAGKEPTIINGRFFSPAMLLVPSNLGPKYNGDWKNSLTKRPEATYI